MVFSFQHWNPFITENCAVSAKILVACVSSLKFTRCDRRVQLFISSCDSRIAFSIIAVMAAMAICDLNVEDVKILTPFYISEPQEFEHVKETLVRVLQKTGLWAATWPMVALAVAMVRCWTMHEQGLAALDASINAQSLGVAKSQLVLSLGDLALNLARGPENELTRMEFCVEKARATLTRWMWEARIAESVDLFSVVRDVKMALQDFGLRLKFVKSHPVTDWPFM